MEDLVASALAGKRVLVTGDTGFKGSWLSLWLHDVGADVLGVALPPKTPEDHFNVAGLANAITHVDCDIRDFSAFAAAVGRFQPEVVFHLAAQALVKESYANPKATFDTNVGGSLNVLEWVRQTGSVKALVLVTSDKCYQNNNWVWGYRENDQLGGDDPYSASKAAAELVFAAYQKSFFAGRDTLGATSVRAGNVIGGGDWSADRLVPDCVRALSANNPIILRSPQSTRPWQHVLEPLSGYLQLASKLLETPQTYAGSWNFGPHPDGGHTVLEVAESLAQGWPEGEIRIEAGDSSQPEAGLLQLSIEKARSGLAWAPRWGFQDTMTHTVDWYKRVHAGELARDVSMSQLNLYREATA